LILLGGKSRENLIAVARSANHELSADDVRASESEIARADAVIAQLEVPLAAVEAAAEIAARHEVPFILNPAPARKLPVRLLRRVHTLIPNETEAEILAGLHEPREAARVLCRRGCQQVIVTLGAQGAYYCAAAGEGRVKAARTKAVDTVGAGDCFSAWLAVGLAESLPLEDSVKRAVRAATIAVTRPGAQSGMPRRAEVIEADVSASAIL
jgi:ribokinase